MSGAGITQLPPQQPAAAEKRGVTQGIVRYMLDNIRSGRWKVGAPIASENTLTAQLGVSRVSVRKAIQQFTVLGIMESVHGKGTFLISDDLSAFDSPENALSDADALRDLREILAFRMLVEPALCGQAAAGAAPALIAKLEALLESMRRAVGESMAFVMADQQFHLEICTACGNSVIAEIMENIFRKRAQPHYLLSLANGYYGGIYYHDLILQALKEHDEKRARSLMLEHLRHGLEDLPQASTQAERE